MTKNYLYRFFFVLFIIACMPFITHAQTLSVVSPSEYSDSIRLSYLFATDFDYFICSGDNLFDVEGVKVKFSGDSTYYSCDTSMMQKFASSRSEKTLGLTVYNYTGTSNYVIRIRLYKDNSSYSPDIANLRTPFLDPGSEDSVNIEDKINVSLKSNNSVTVPVSSNAKGGGFLVFNTPSNSGFKLTDGSHDVVYTIAPEDDPANVVGENKETKNGNYNITFNPQNLALFSGKYNGLLNVTIKPD